MSVGSYTIEVRDWANKGRTPSMHPYIRYYCGFVEHLCRLFDRSENIRTADILMREINDIYTLKHKYRHSIDKRLLDRIHYRYVVHIGSLHNIYISEECVYTLRSLEQTNTLVWSYSLVRHILEYDHLSLIDQLYVLKWLNRLTYPSLVGMYIGRSNSVYHMFWHHLSMHFLIINMKHPAKPVDYPAHRPAYICGNERAEGLGCYVQTYEGYFGKSITYDLDDQTITEPFNRKFIRDIYEPLLRSNTDSIIICIDRATDSSEEHISAFIEELQSVERSLISKSKTYVIVPDRHINAPVGRNLMFSFIRAYLAESYLLWFGSDDDDRINSAGVDQLIEFIRKHRTEMRQVLLFDEKFKSPQRKRSDKRTYVRYAPWTYAFSPEYYNGLSYRCVPMEKEDLDFFNRLMQYENALNIPDTISIDPPLYVYYGTTKKHPSDESPKMTDKRPKNNDLFETGDVIDYMNIHNIIESNPDIATPAPQSSEHISPASKVYRLNASERYFYHESVNDESMILCKDGKYRKSTYHGLSNEDSGKRDTNRDITERRNGKRKKLMDLLRRKPITENFDGDLFIYPYKVYTSIDPINRHDWLSRDGEAEKDIPNITIESRVLTGIAFQHGKLPSTERIKRIPTRVGIIDASANDRSLEGELIAVAKELETLFTPDEYPLTEAHIKAIDRWNKHYIDHYRNRHIMIPLKTFGGRHAGLYSIYWIILSFIIIGIVIIILLFRREWISSDSFVRFRI